MTRKRVSEERIVYALRRLEAGSTGLEVCRELGGERTDAVQLEAEV